MTREQAEIVLHSIKFILDNAQYSDDVEEALNIAIEELKNSKRTEKSSQNVSNDDLISRQAAIDALGDEPEVWTGRDEYAQGLNNQWHYDKNAIKALPSAQPERKTGRWILVKGSNGKDYHKCSECLHTQEITGIKNYCAVCGADMRGEE